MNNKNNGIKIFSGIGWSFAEKIFVQMVSLLISIILARILSPEDYGILALINVFIAIGDALVISGFGLALVQKKDSNEQDFNSICWLNIGFSLILYILLFIGAPFIAKFYENNKLILITRVLGLRLFFLAVNSIQQAYIQKYMIFRKNFIISMIGAILSGIISIILAMSGAGVWSLIVQNLSLVIFNTIFLFMVIEWKPVFECSQRSIKKMWKYGSRVFFATIIDALKDNIRSLVIGKVFSSSDLAFYNQGKRFPQLLVNDIVNSIGKVLFPVFSENQGNIEKNKKLMRFSIQISSFILLPMIFGLIGIADNFISLFLTEKWIFCVPYLRILSLVYVTRPINTILKNSLLSIGRSDVNLFHEVVTSIVTIILIFIAAISLKNIQMIAWSYVIVSVIGTVIFSYYVKKEYSYTILQILYDYMPSFILSVVMSFVVFFIGKIQVNLALRLFFQVSIGVSIYISLAYILNMKEFYYVKKLIERKIFHKEVK